MTTPIELAVAYKKEHPEMSYKAVAALKSVHPSTLYYHMSDAHTSSAAAAHRNLSLPQEDALVRQILAYSDRGTHLEPRHITELAQIIKGAKIGDRWTSRFLNRHQARLESKYHSHEEAERWRADTPETRAAFFDIVRPMTFFYPWLTYAG